MHGSCPSTRLRWLKVSCVSVSLLNEKLRAVDARVTNSATALSSIDDRGTLAERASKGRFAMKFIPFQNTNKTRIELRTEVSHGNKGTTGKLCLSLADKCIHLCVTATTRV